MLVDVNKNKEEELGHLEDLKKGLAMLEFSLQRATGPQQRHKLITLLDMIQTITRKLTANILDDLRTYGTGVKLLYDQRLIISASFPAIINRFKKKYKRTSNMRRSDEDYYNDTSFIIPKGTLGIISSVYTTSTTLKYNIGIPDPETNKLTHGSVIKDVKLDAFTTNLTDEEKKFLETVQLNEVLKREDNNLRAIEKMGKI